MNKAQAKKEAKKIAAGLICQALAGEWDETETHIQAACKTDRTSASIKARPMAPKRYNIFR